MTLRRILGSTLLVVLLGPLAGAAEGAGAARTRPGGPASSAGRHAVSGTRSPHAPPRAASGRATYGYHHGSRAYLRYPYPFYYPGFWWWGWPYYGFGAWWYPGAYGGVVPFPADDWDESAPGVVETDVHPRKATVRLDGEVVGEARDYDGRWDRLEIPPGDHVLEFEAPGYMTLRVSLQGRPGRYYRIERSLRRGEGLDPRSTRSSRETSPVIEPGDEAVETEGPPGIQGRAPGLHPGFLKIVAQPPDSAVYLDGEFLASARELLQLHGGIPVAQGEHRVEVVRPGRETRSVEVNVSGSEPVRVQIELTPQGTER